MVVRKTLHGFHHRLIPTRRGLSGPIVDAVRLFARILARYEACHDDRRANEAPLRLTRIGQQLRTFERLFSEAALRAYDGTQACYC